MIFEFEPSNGLSVDNSSLAESIIVLPESEKLVSGVGAIGVSSSIMIYALAGTIGTSIHFVVLVILEPLSGPVVATSIGAACGAIANYTLARRFVFQHDGHVIRTMPKFMITATFGVVSNGAAMALLIQVLPLLVSQMFASSLVLVSGYTINRFWTFR